MRQFIRHPVDVPVDIGTRGSRAASALHTHDISLGGSEQAAIERIARHAAEFPSIGPYLTH